jgi:hypothetical protein
MSGSVPNDNPNALDVPCIQEYDSVSLNILGRQASSMWFIYWYSPTWEQQRFCKSGRKSRIRNEVECIQQVQGDSGK